MNQKPEDFSDLSERIRRLERQNGLVKGGLLGTALLLGAALLMGQAGPASSTLEGRKLILRDEAGKVRVELSSNGTGLILYDAGERAQVMLGNMGDESHLSLSSSSGGSTKLMLQVAGDSPELRLHDESGRTRVRLNGTGKLPVLALLDGAEKTRLLVDATGSLLRIAQRDQSGKSAKTPIKGDEPGIGFFDANGSLTSMLP